MTPDNVEVNPGTIPGPGYMDPLESRITYMDRGPETGNVGPCRSPYRDVGTITYHPEGLTFFDGPGGYHDGP